MKRKHRLFMVLSIIVVVTIFAATYRTKQVTMDDIQLTLSQNIIRFHVRANSDSEQDQAVKLKVKEAVVNYLSPLLSESQSIAESRSILTARSDNIRELADSVLAENGFDQTTKVYFERCYFPMKVYDDITFPPGEYEAFRIDIGSHQGKNWWCVLYPPLCFVDSVCSTVPNESKDCLKNFLTDDEYNAITNTQYVFKFKYLTFLNKLMEAQ